MDRTLTDIHLSWEHRPPAGSRHRVFRGRKPKAFSLYQRDLLLLVQLLAKGLLPRRAARRAQILLWRAQGERIAPVAGDVKHHRATVWRVCRRYALGGLQAALFDAPRTGRPRTTPLDVAKASVAAAGYDV